MKKNFICNGVEQDFKKTPQILKLFSYLDMIQ